MDPREFLTLADELRSSDRECALRTSVSRSYYGLFNFLRQDIAQEKAFSGGVQDHARVHQYLTAANNSVMRSVGVTVHDLRNERNRADYELAPALEKTTCDLAYSKATKALERYLAIPEATRRAAIRAQPTR